MFSLRCLCLRAHSGVQHILCCVFCFLVFVFCQCVTSLGGLSIRFSLTFIYLFSVLCISPVKYIVPTATVLNYYSGMLPYSLGVIQYRDTGSFVIHWSMHWKSITLPSYLHRCMKIMFYLGNIYPHYVVLILFKQTMVPRSVKIFGLHIFT